MGRRRKNKFLLRVRDALNEAREKVAMFGFKVLSLSLAEKKLLVENPRTGSRWCVVLSVGWDGWNWSWIPA